MRNTTNYMSNNISLIEDQFGPIKRGKKKDGYSYSFFLSYQIHCRKLQFEYVFFAYIKSTSIYCIYVESIAVISFIASFFLSYIIISIPSPRHNHPSFLPSFFTSLSHSLSIYNSIFLYITNTLECVSGLCKLNRLESCQIITWYQS